jgi:hypothetical protein
MSWHYSQALEAAFLAENSLDGAPSAPLSGTLTHGTFWSPDKTTDASTRSRSGMTYRPLTDDLGEAVLTWCLAASRAKTFPLPEKVPESKENEVACGSTWHESSVRFDLVSHSWKTHQCLWDEDLQPSSLTLPKWGMTRNGALWERTTSPLPTNGTESGSWPTPDAQAMNLNADPVKHMERLARLKEKHNNGNGAGLTLGVAVKMWPTPAARDCKGSNSRQHCETNGTGRKHMDQLANAVAYPDIRFATPQARDFRTGSTERWDNPERSRNLNDQIGGQLNPTWVEWLMGWPLFWTTLDVDVKPYYNAWHEAKQRTQASPEEIQNRIMRNVWWDIDPSAAPQRREPNQQREIKCDGCMPDVPCENTLLNRELGEGKREAIGMQDLWGNIQAETDAEIKVMWQAGMPEGKRETISRVAMGVKSRVDRLRCIGNGQVPAVVRLAWNHLTKGDF